MHFKENKLTQYYENMDYPHNNPWKISHHSLLDYGVENLQVCVGQDPTWVFSLFQRFFIFFARSYVGWFLTFKSSKWVQYCVSLKQVVHSTLTNFWEIPLLMSILYINFVYLVWIFLPSVYSFVWDFISSVKMLYFVCVYIH